MSIAHPTLTEMALPGRTGASRVGLPARSIIILALLAATIVGFVQTDAQQSAHAVALAGPDLTRLLRAMAAIKAMMALAAAGVVLWRLGAPASPVQLAAYALACAAMGAGPGLIWNMEHVGLGALLLHAGLAANIILLWRDPGMSARLAEKLRAR